MTISSDKNSGNISNLHPETNYGFIMYSIVEIEPNNWYESVKYVNYTETLVDTYPKLKDPSAGI